MNNSLLVVNHLSYAIGKQQIINNFSMKASQGQVISIIGSNKCGKSTLIKLLSGEYISNDKIIVNKMALNDKTKESYKRRVSIISKDNSKQLIRVKDYILESKDDEKHFDHLIALFDIASLVNKTINKLSVDNFIKVEFCRELMKKPNLLLVDYTAINPSLSLKQKLSEFYKSFVKNKGCVIFATNNIEDIYISDTTYVLHKGEVALKGKTKEVFKHDSMLIKLGIELPFEVNLSLKLKMYGLIDDIYYDVEELVNKLWK